MTSGVPKLAGRDSKRKRTTHSGSQSSDESSEESDFHEGVSRRRQSETEVYRMWKRHPGQLTQRALKQMAVLLGDRGTPELQEADYAPIVTAFVNTVLFPKHSEKALPVRASREISTLALAMDCLLRGDALKSLDVMTQRLKALEQSALDDGWSVARWHELIPTGAALLTDRVETRAAQTSVRAEKRSRNKA